MLGLCPVAPNQPNNRQLWIRRLITFVAGQLLALLIPVFGTASSVLSSDFGVNLPFFLPACAYLLIWVVFNLAARLVLPCNTCHLSPWRLRGFTLPPWWLYPVVGFFESQGLVLLTAAFNLTTLSSVALLAAVAIPITALINGVFLGYRFNLYQVLGVLLTLGGLAATAVSDYLSERESAGTAFSVQSLLFGDLLAALSSVFFGLSNGIEEYMLIRARRSVDETVGGTTHSGSDADAAAATKHPAGDTHAAADTGEEAVGPKQPVPISFDAAGQVDAPSVSAYPAQTVSPQQPVHMPGPAPVSSPGRQSPPRSARGPGSGPRWTSGGKQDGPGGALADPGDDEGGSRLDGGTGSMPWPARHPHAWITGDYLAQEPFWAGLLLFSESAIFEHNTLLQIAHLTPSDPGIAAATTVYIWLLILLFACASFSETSLLAWFLQVGTATEYNVVIVASNVYSVLIGVLVLHQPISVLYPVSFLLTVGGVIVYQASSPKKEDVLRHTTNAGGGGSGTDGGSGTATGTDPGAASEAALQDVLRSTVDMDAEAIALE